MKKVYLIIAILTVAAFAFATDVKKLDAAHDGFDCIDCHQTENPTKRPPVAGCLECHESYEAVAERTAQFSPNPHASHQGEIRCSQCHKPHSEDKLFCNECHDLQIYKFN